MSAVVFDLDGTLADTLDILPAVYVGSIRAAGGPDVTPAEVVAMWHIGPSPVVFAHYLGDGGLVPAALDHFYRRLAVALADVTLFPGVVDVLGSLHGDGWRIGVLSNATRHNADHVLGVTGLSAFVEASVTADEVAPKPAPDGLLRLCAELGADLGDTVMIGDSWNDLAAAANAGVRGIHVTWAAAGQCTLVDLHECVATPGHLATTVTKATMKGGQRGLAGCLPGPGE